MKSIHKIGLSIFFILILWSCKKDHGVLGVEVQPGEDGLSADYIGDLPVTGHSLPYDSIASFNDGWKYLGSNFDPYFGRTDVGLYVNTSITTTDWTFKSDDKLISSEIILILDNDWTGDTTSSITYSVFPVDSVLDSSKRIYYSTNTRLHNKTMICSHTGKFSTMRIPGSSSSLKVPVLRIKIDPTYANSIMSDNENLKSNEIYQAKYKGYYIAASIASGNEGTIFKADLDHDYSGFHIFYNNAAIPQDTLDFNFKFKGSNQTRFNTVKFDYNQNLKNQFLDSTLGSGNLFLKGLGNTKLKIQIPFLQNYSDSFQVAVNRAELILNLDPSYAGGLNGNVNYTYPPNLTLLSIDTLSRETFIEDLLSAVDFVRYDGTYDKYNQRYVFNLAREAQLIFRGQKKNRGFYLVVANTGQSLLTAYNVGSKDLVSVRRDNYVERVVLAGSGNPSRKPKFNLSFVKFKND